jgi:hypothetical protein
MKKNIKISLWGCYAFGFWRQTTSRAECEGGGMNAIGGVCVGPKITVME